MKRSLLSLSLLVACGPLPKPGEAARGDAAPVIDRFSASSGRLMVRDTMDGLPAPGQAIDLDRAPFISQGLGPDGKPARYYNFDVQSPVPALRYALTRAGERVRLPGQPDLIDVLPGDPGYSDFWQLTWVEVPASYQPGELTSAAALLARGYPAVPSGEAVNCPVVPAGSTARARPGVDSSAPEALFYRGHQVFCMAFDAPLLLDSGLVPTSAIYVAFQRDPGQPGGGPASGFRREPGTQQTHNVLSSLPGDTDYSPLWSVKIYAGIEFDSVRDAESAARARLVEQGPLVNCPVATAP